MPEAKLSIQALREKLVGSRVTTVTFEDWNVFTVKTLSFDSGVELEFNDGLVYVHVDGVYVRATEEH